MDIDPQPPPPSGDGPWGGEAELAEGLALIRAGLAKVVAVDVEMLTDEAVVAGWDDLERLSRTQSASHASLLGEVDRREVHREDGFNSVRTLARYKAKLSFGEATRRDQSMRVCRDLPAVAAAWRAGRVSDCHVALLGRVHGNRRVRNLMPEFDDWFLEQALELSSYQDFEQVIREWERLADEDGPKPDHHESRDAKLTQNPLDLSWDLSGHFGSLEGASLNEIFQHYVAAERLADWEKAKAEFGDAASEADLARTEPQRRADALAQIFRDAAANTDSAVPAKFVHNIVWTAATFEAMIRLLATHLQPNPEGEAEGEKSGMRFDPDDYRCSTIDGVPVDPTAAIVNAVLNQVRRVIVNAQGTVIDLGQARCFTGSARHAVQLQATHCVWPGCWVPTTQCETDHLIEHAKQGRTHPGNGAPLCGRHNRWKQKGFTIWRDPNGTWHTTRPDGTEIQPL